MNQCLPGGLYRSQLCCQARSAERGADTAARGCICNELRLVKVLQMCGLLAELRRLDGDIGYACQRPAVHKPKPRATFSPLQLRLFCDRENALVTCHAWPCVCACAWCLLESHPVIADLVQKSTACLCARMLSCMRHQIDYILHSWTSRKFVTHHLTASGAAPQ